ncbi:PIG-L family deacetylase [Okibacterium fritillariae]|uniref:PIG-L family deacetylase n=1 Tax=Okibacterium fritillariae TaxID=123320 RepID=UPI004055832C
MTFTHLDAGTPESAWLEAAPWQRTPAWSLDGITHLFVTAAHPDDETLGAGGVMAQASARGIPVTAIIASDGEASHPDSPTTTPEALAAWRRDEVAQALDIVAPGSRRHFLGLPDGGLAQSAELAELIAGVVSGVLGTATATTAGADAGPVADTDTDTDTDTGVIDAVILSPWAGDRHPDHAAVATASARAAERHGLRAAAYPIWGWLWSDVEGDDIPWNDALVLPLSDEDRERKRQAMASHSSQTAPLSEHPGDEAILSEPFQEHFRRDVEIFLPSVTDRATVIDTETASGTAPDETAPSETDGGADGSLGADFFTDFYAGERDPWGFETRWYEERKRAITLASLPAARYANVLELGSSIGVTTALLAERADALLATDIAESALEVARERLAGRDNVTFERRTLPGDWPPGSFDLVVVSEVGYYLSSAELDALIDRILGSLTPDATVVTCHWRHPVEEYPLDGDTVTERFRERLRPRLELTVTHTERDFVLDVFRTAPGRSVAQETGLAE